MKIAQIAFISSVYALVIIGFTAQALAQSRDVTCQIEWVEMRDGVTLATEVYLPAEPGRHPVVLTRSPYTRGSLAAGSNCDNQQFLEFARAGYVGLNQDTRGRYRSGGSFDPFQQEGPDGYDSVEWAATQPWSNGRVGIFGSSYTGATALQATITDLKLI